ALEYMRQIVDNVLRLAGRCPTLTLRGDRVAHNLPSWPQQALALESEERSARVRPRRQQPCGRWRARAESAREHRAQIGERSSARGGAIDALFALEGEPLP